MIWTQSRRLAIPLVLGLATIVAAPAGWAQSDETPPTPSWAQGPFLSGDWGGLRTRLADRGFAPYGIYSV